MIVVDMTKKKRTKGFSRTFIREWRQHRNLTLEQLASRIDLTNGNLSRVERGQVPYSQPVLEALAIALNCRPADLIMRPPGVEDELQAVFGEMSPETKRTALALVKTLRDQAKAA